MRELKYRCLHNNKIKKVHSLHLNSKKAIVSYSGGGEIIFWIFWILLTGGCVFGFFYIDNKWLE